NDFSGVASPAQDGSNGARNLGCSGILSANKSNKCCGSDAVMEEKGIFDGLKVLDCASFIAAPAAATVLSDFGADVIKIEPPGEGDLYRSLHTRPGSPKGPRDYAWMLDSRNKRGLALDLKAPGGHEVLCRLVKSADIFITNMPLPGRRRLKTAYKDLASLNPRLIYASFTAY